MLRVSRRGLLLGSVAAAAGLTTLRLAAPARAMASGAHHALLVAVTEYPRLSRNNWLTGPNNDARLVRNYLVNESPARFAPENVTVLADNFDGAAASPTLSAIRTAMSDLAERVAPGDFVYMHFSGHGHQQPARFPEQEIDGLDEVFMPADCEIMTRESRAWPNAYVDKDIRDDLEAIRGKGAFVWAVFDCCHSATLTRNVEQLSEDITPRQVDARELGVPDDVWQGVARSATGTPGRHMFSGREEPQDLAGQVAFFASQTIEPTFELPLPRGAENATKMGLFTFTLLETLGRNPMISYRQLGQAVMQSYVGMNRRSPTPMFEGDLDAPVFGSDGLEFVPQWMVLDTAAGKEIPAGNLHQLAPGTRLAVLPSAASALDEALGLVAVGTVEALRSTLAPVILAEDEEAPALPLLDPADIPQGQFVRMVERVVDMDLTVALPAPTGAHDAQVAAVRAMLEEFASDMSAPIRLTLVDPGSPADVSFGVMTRAEALALIDAQQEVDVVPAGTRATAMTQVDPELWLLDSVAEVSLLPGRTPPALNLARNDPEAQQRWLRQTLLSVYRATNLARLATHDDFGRGDVVAKVRLVRPQDRDEEVLQPQAVPQAKPGNQIHLTVENNASVPVDVNVLFIGADYSIVAAPPERFQPGNRRDVPLFGISDSSFGRERVVVVVTEPDRIGDGNIFDTMLDLRFLSQTGVTTRGLGGSRGLASGLADLLKDVGEAPATRSAVLLGGGGQTDARGALQVYSLDVVPDA